MKNKINRQRFIFNSLFILIVITLFFYLVFALSITEFSGYVIYKNNQIRLTEEIALLEYYVHPGEIVKEGDTLFSYINVNWINDVANPNLLVSSDLRKLDAIKRCRHLRSQYRLEKESADSLHLLLKKEEADLQLGVTTLRMVEERRWEYFTMREQVQHTKRLVDIEEEEAIASAKYLSYGDNLEPFSYYTSTELFRNKAVFGKSLRYKRAYKDMQIVNLNATVGDIVFSKEPVLTFNAYNSPDMSDFHIQLLLPPDALYSIEDKTNMRIYSGRHYLGEAQVSFASTYTEEVDPQKLSVFGRDKVAVIVRMQVLTMGDFPVKYQVDKLPVTLVHDRWKDFIGENLFIQTFIQLIR